MVPNTRTGMQPLADNLAYELDRRDARNTDALRAIVRDELEGVQIVIDGKKLVGSISGRMSRALVM